MFGKRDTFIYPLFWAWGMGSGGLVDLIDLVGWLVGWSVGLGG